MSVSPDNVSGCESLFYINTQNRARLFSLIAGVEAWVTLAPPAAVLAAMLYGVAADDEQVRELVENENLRTRTTQGSIMGMLGWKWSQVYDRFFRQYILQIYQR